MERRNVSVPALAEALDVTEKTIYYWRNDKTTVSEARIPKLAEALGISEIEARRGLGHWVPDVSAATPHPAADLGEIEEQLELVRTVIDGLLARIKLDRAEPEPPAIRSVDKLDHYTSLRSSLSRH
jgi:transcriptional regulator with XRE-family HTH domain